ncbi:4744_t:CDS:2 [Acaulospora colombiana]|uniref:4744_t:CDS:1 n=1 Tax=Acaulospora colombiana TaxID=27376 RepID=A0ACA9MJR6_9GLOM|nr:4744_t:CDS:2 [Acaulospora colombiana]
MAISKARIISSNAAEEYVPRKSSHIQQRYRDLSADGLRSGTTTVVPTRQSSPAPPAESPPPTTSSAPSKKLRGRSSAKRAVGLSRLDTTAAIPKPILEQPPSARPIAASKTTCPVGLNTSNLPRVGVEVCTRWLTGKPPTTSSFQRRRDKHIVSRLDRVLASVIRDVKETIDDLEVEKSMCIIQSLHEVSIVELDNYWEVIDLEEKVDDMRQCMEKIEVIRDDLLQNKRLRPIVDYDDEMEDSAWWNDKLQPSRSDKRSYTWLTAPPLFAESYLYRRLKECFAQSIWWRNYDPFKRKKSNDLLSAQDKLFELASRFAEPFRPGDCLFPEEYQELVKLRFIELTQVCLEGDSSISIESKDSTECVSSALTNAEGDNPEEILGVLWEAFNAPCSSGAAGSLTPQLHMPVTAEFLIDSGIADEVRFHGKQMPWFVSNATQDDWEWLLDALANPRLYPNASLEQTHSLRQIGQRWRAYEQSKQFVYEQHPFWTTPHSFWDLPTSTRSLFSELSSSNLTIFKGGLNYRRLTYDCTAPPETSFEERIGPMSFHPKLPTICSLRTVGKYAIVDLSRGDRSGPNKGVAEEK